jgi:hypothetical protein
VKIKFNHSKNQHSLQGPVALLPVVFDQIKLDSLIDVGCGIGTWTKAAMDLGVKDILGLDGVNVPTEQLLIPQESFLIQDLTQDWDLGRRFDMALCLEVGEHLEQQFAARLVRSLARHSDNVVFSAACPGQAGQYHVNCQWPAFWQKLFNAEGFFCEDSLRWKIWDDCRIEPWYRQNVFVAKRAPARAGREERLRPVVHPEFLYGTEYEIVRNARFSSMTAIEGGEMTVGWYLSTPLKGLRAKLAKRMRASSQA